VDQSTQPLCDQELPGNQEIKAARLGSCRSFSLEMELPMSEFGGCSVDGDLGMNESEFISYSHKIVFIVV
jgi:hypothetical protein